MKTYKEVETIDLGISDVAALFMVGLDEQHEFDMQPLQFGEDGHYKAYLITEPDVKIGEHYQLVHTFHSWLKIYDEEKLVLNRCGKTINVYRAGMYGCIIEILF